MSAPAEYSIGFAEAMTSARTPSSPSTRSHTRASSRMSWGEIELAGGFSSQAIATSPRVSSFTVSPWSKPSSGRG